MDKWERTWQVNQMPLDVLMDEKKLREFRDMFLAHIIESENEKKELDKKLIQVDMTINSLKEKHQTIDEYIKFLEFGGHDFAKAIVKDNHHVFSNAQEKIHGYKICAKEVKTKSDGWHVCIRKENHKGKCSNVTPDRRNRN